MTEKDLSLEQCQELIGYRFQEPRLLEKALIHASASDQRLNSNERLEFLGDAVLGMVICHELFQRFSDYLEGELTKVKSMIVSRRTCGQIAEQIGLARFLRIGKGMSAHRTLPRSCAAAAIESVIGAIFVDGGIEPARAFILHHFKPVLQEADAQQHQGNFKSMLQQYAQHALDTTPMYELLDEKGPDHSKCFEVSVVIGNRRFTGGWGPSKKEAEQLAAYHALQELDVLPQDQPFPAHAVD